MENVVKFCTLMTETYEVKYEPSLCEFTSHVRVIEHKTRPRLEEIKLRERYHRPLSAVLASRPRDPAMDKNHSSMHTLH